MFNKPVVRFDKECSPKGVPTEQLVRLAMPGLPLEKRLQIARNKAQAFARSPASPAKAEKLLRATTAAAR